VHDWADTDRVVGAARERDLDVLGLLVYTPAWARPEGTTDKHPPSDLDDFARFAAAAVERYAPVGIEVWEIWNEPNSGLFWEPGPDPTRYAQLVERVTVAIRSIDPEARVVTGGLAPAPDDLPAELSPQQFLRQMYEVLEPGTVDAVGIHPYSFPADPSDVSKHWNLFARLPEIHDLVIEAEGRSVSLWLTEFGAPFDEEDPDRQAEIVLEGVSCATQWPWVGAVFVYNLRDATEPSDEPGFGLIFDDGRQRPVWAELRAFLRAAAGDPIDSACPTIGEADESTP
jgi:polysaccharide biosynthesis protein PslG